MSYTTTTTIKRRNQREDTKQKVMMACIPLLAVILIMILTKSFKKPLSAKSKTDTPSSQSHNKHQVSDIAWTSPEPYDANYADPMRLEKPVRPMVPKPIHMKPEPITDNTKPSPSRPNLHINGIIYAQGNPSVLIDTEIYTEGDIVDGAKILHISQDKVVLEKDGQQWEVFIQIGQ